MAVDGVSVFDLGLSDKELHALMGVEDYSELDNSQDSDRTPMAVLVRDLEAEVRKELVGECPFKVCVDEGNGCFRDREGNGRMYPLWCDPSRCGSGEWSERKKESDRRKKEYLEYLNNGGEYDK